MSSRAYMRCRFISQPGQQPVVSLRRDSTPPESHHRGFNSNPCFGAQPPRKIAQFIQRKNFGERFIPGSKVLVLQPLPNIPEYPYLRKYPLLFRCFERSSTRDAVDYALCLERCRGRSFANSAWDLLLLLVLLIADRL